AVRAAKPTPLQHGAHRSKQVSPAIHGNATNRDNPEKAANYRPFRASSRTDAPSIVGTLRQAKSLCPVRVRITRQFSHLIISERYSFDNFGTLLPFGGSSGRFCHKCEVPTGPGNVC